MYDKTMTEKGNTENTEILMINMDQNMHIIIQKSNCVAGNKYRGWNCSRFPMSKVCT